MSDSAGPRSSARGGDGDARSSYYHEYDDFEDERGASPRDERRRGQQQQHQQQPGRGSDLDRQKSHYEDDPRRRGG
jgi:hypothetical protein